MTASITGAQTDATAANADDRTSAMCAVCPHPVDTHDVIGLRYCTATVAGGWQRGCVCGNGRKANHHGAMRK
ncbi:MAG TPA: RGCVC family protein [Pseudonocardiaceae bacterium]|jgi:hypothetical protein|nr:RGCVC family protein [Pseudonocardiaceae bacterium]